MLRIHESKALIFRFYSNWKYSMKRVDARKKYAAFSGGDGEKKLTCSAALGLLFLFSPNRARSRAQWRSLVSRDFIVVLFIFWMARLMRFAHGFAFANMGMASALLWVRCAMKNRRAVCVCVCGSCLYPRFCVTIKTFSVCSGWRWRKTEEKVLHEICYTASKNNADNNNLINAMPDNRLLFAGMTATSQRQKNKLRTNTHTHTLWQVVCDRRPSVLHIIRTVGIFHCHMQGLHDIVHLQLIDNRRLCAHCVRARFSFVWRCVVLFDILLWKNIVRESRPENPIMI